MADRFNPASRVAQFMKTARKQSTDIQTVQAWTNVFGIELKDQRQQMNEVNQGLELLAGEIGLITEQVNAGKAGAPQRYANALKNARQAISILDFSPRFSQCLQYIKSDEINLLEIISDLTPDEERADEKALSEVEDRLAELKEYAVEHLEGPFRAFVLRQIQIMEEAIRRYPFIGIKAFSEGATLSFVNFVQNQEVFRDATDEEAKTRLKELVRKFFQLAPETVVKGAQVVNAANTIKEITGN